MKTIGIKLADGSFYPVLQENMPSEKSLDLTTAHNNQTKVMVDLYRSELCTMDDAEYVDSLEINGLIAHPNGEPDISFIVSIDDENKLSAKIVDTETGSQSKTTISLVSRTAEERMITDEYGISDSPNTDESKNAAKAAGVAVAGAGLLAAAEALRKQKEENDKADVTFTPDGAEDEMFATNEDIASTGDTITQDDIFASGDDTVADDTFAANDDAAADDMFASTEDTTGSDTTEEFSTNDLPSFDDLANTADSAAADDNIPAQDDIFASGDDTVADDTFAANDDAAADDMFASTEDTAVSDDLFNADTTISEEASSEENSDEPLISDDDLPSFDDISLGDDKVNKDEDIFADFDDSPAPASGLSFTGLYDKETELGNSSDYSEEQRKKTKVPVIICIICAIICVIATALILFIIPSKYNLITKKNYTETEQIVKEEVPPVIEKEEPPVVEPKVEPVPQAKEDEIVIIEKAEEVIPEPPAPVVEKPKNISYKIKWGDTLWDIADTYYKNPWRYKYIARYNGIKNPDYIISGTTIIIPAE